MEVATADHMIQNVLFIIANDLWIFGGLHALLVIVGVFPGYYNKSLPQFKNMHVSLTGDSK